MGESGAAGEGYSPGPGRLGVRIGILEKALPIDFVNAGRLPQSECQNGGARAGACAEQAQETRQPEPGIPGFGRAAAWAQPTMRFPPRERAEFMYDWRRRPGHSVGRSSWWV